MTGVLRDVLGVSKKNFMQIGVRPLYRTFTKFYLYVVQKLGNFFEILNFFYRGKEVLELHETCRSVKKISTICEKTYKNFRAHPLV